MITEQANGPVSRELGAAGQRRARRRGAGLTAILVRAGVNAIAVATPFLAAAVGTGLVVDPPTPVVANGRGVSPAERVVEAHDCWTGQAPPDMRGRLPGHVVVTRNGRTVYSTAQVGPALEQLFEGTDHGLTVHAFCR